MLRAARAFAAALSLLLAAATAQAAGLNRPPFEIPSGPIEPGVIDPTNPCIFHPELCPENPPVPPPDPCIENPEICEPEPPPPGDTLCDLSPALCDDDIPTVVLPTAPVTTGLFGAAKVKAGGVKVFEGFFLSLSYDETAGTFMAIDESQNAYTGHLTSTGNTGRKFTLFLDDGSGDVFAQYVAERGAAAAGSQGGTLAGHTTKWTLKLRADGSVALKIRSDVLLSGVGEIVFKANLTPSEDRP
jgi:hypothetical protein